MRKYKYYFTVDAFKHRATLCLEVRADSPEKAWERCMQHLARSQFQNIKGHDRLG